MVWRVRALKVTAGGTKDSSTGTFNGSNDRAMKDLPHPVCESEVGGWQIIFRPQGLEHFFLILSKMERGDWKVLA